MKLNTQLKKELKELAIARLKGEKHVIHVISPYVLTPSELVHLENTYQFMAGHEIVQEVRSEMLAGIIIQVGSQVIDLSLDTQLHQLEKFVYEHS
ncbi:MAG: F0F1 ATP synthase subunit delta [Candidatus Roizmanbacteria bacterium]